MSRTIRVYMFVLEQCSVEHVELGGLGGGGGLGGARGPRGIYVVDMYSAYIFTLWDYHDQYSGAKLI